MDLIGMREDEIRECLAVGELDRHQRKEARDFLERRGPFKLMDRSEPGREQVFPGPEPPTERQTHKGRRYRDGT